jgi:hypothetical protein
MTAVEHMVDKVLDAGLATLLAVAGISGGIGGCTIVAHNVLRGRVMTSALVAAYVFIGFVFGIAGTLMSTAVFGFAPSFEKLVLINLFFGMAGSIALASANLSIRFLLKRLGIEVEVTVRKTESGERE